MAKFRLTKSKTRKAAIATLCAVAVTCTSLAAACRPNEGSPDDDTTKAEDTSLLLNGSFEFFDVPDDGVYLIKNVQNWSRSGDSSGTMSGIISTANKDWDATKANSFTDPDLADRLDKNKALLTSDEDYVDYNGMKSDDILYREPYAAKLEASAVKDDKIINKNDLSYAEFLGIKVTEGADDNPDTYTYGEGDDAVEVYLNEDDGDFYFDTDYTRPVRKEVIENPGTHYGSYRYDAASGKHYLGDGDEKEIFLDDDGNYYKDEKKEYSEGNVLMIHNYPTDSKYNGIQQYYSSSTITLEARTAAKISVWVKTSDLKFDKGYSLLDEQDRGAFIEVIQTVGGTTIDAFTIKAINTEKIIADPDNGVTGSNGWLQYNIYVNSCDFASSTVQLRLGLGKPNGETCTGYAFFDDVTVEKELNIENFENYDEIESEIYSADHETYCTLSSTDDDKVFYADKAVRDSDDDRHSTHFNYLIDLASESGKAGEDGYKAVVWDKDSNLTAGLTTEEADGFTYASAEKFDESGKVYNLNRPDGTYRLYKNSTARPTDGDLLGLITSGDDFSSSGIASNYATALKNALFGEKTKLTTWDDSSSKMLVMFSAWGAAYTTTISDYEDGFTLKEGEQMIVSFWVKTSDMKGKTAATIKIYDKDDKDNFKELTLDTTDIKTDIGDDKDIYNGWVQCFFFVKNETKSNKTFQIDFCFGNTSIISANSYDSGWVALANMQALKVSEEVYNLNASASYNQKFQFENDNTEKEHNKFADALGTYDITDEISAPNGYNGVNGGSTSVDPDADYNHNFDVWDTNREAGLINRDNFFGDDDTPTDWKGILSKFKSDLSANVNWDEVFGKDCYQPLIIVNNLRRYADKAHATEDNYTDYYVLVDDGYSGDDVIVDPSGRHYKKAGDEPFDKDETYYSIKEVVNYGFVSADRLVSANSTQTVSVRVMVSEGATAYIYLVDTATREVMSYSLPGYTFWYDDDGNVLDEEFDDTWDTEEREEHVVYELQDNGLYKDKDKNFVANLHNLKKIYIKAKLDTYYYRENNDPEGAIKEFGGAKCVEGIDYYTDAEATIPAPHRLCNSDDTPIFEYKNGDYYYIVNGKLTDTKVGNFDTQFARYNYNADDENGVALDKVEYCVAVGNTNGEWVTVNFVLQTGNKSKSYRLELWSGERGTTGADDNLATEDEVSGAIAFDYSAYSITSSNYDTITEYYENEIITKYQNLLRDAGHADKIDLESDTISDYEKLAEEYLDESAYEDLKKTYTAHYYAYSLYDSEAFTPFNKDVAADGETGYEYKATDYSETLAFFRNENKNSEGVTTAYNVFIDYSVVDKEISKSSAPADGNTGNNNGNDENNSGDFWLQLASILLVVVLLFVLLALVARIVIKEIKRNKKIKDQSKNVYRKRERYLRRLHIEAEETEEIDNPALQNTEETEAPAEEVTEETPVEEAPSEEVTEEAPKETPVEETPAETTETPSENSEDKPE